MADLRIGTCSWRFPSWHGLVYPAPKGINYLQAYAEHYDTVEIDRWFWSLFGEDSIGLPDPADVEEYRRSVPDDFVFTVKAPNSVTLTHFYKRAKTDPLLENPYFLSPSLFRTFLSLLDPLGDKLGPVMFQFEYLNRQKMPSQSRFQELFEVFSEQLPTGYQYGIEVRNGRYLNRSYFEFLSRSGLSPVLLQGYWMPPIAGVYEDWRDLIVQHETVVVRLLGPDRKGIEKQTGKHWDQIVAPRDEELVAIVEMVEDLLDRGVSVYLNVNNHYEGSAPLTIERISRLLRQDASAVPGQR
jgi:uncharacterized protein YecE (DUF72 family)